MDLENLIIEGSRQLREWEQLQDEIPSLDMSLKFTDRPGANLRNINLNVEEWRVVSYINPRNTIRQIASTTKMNDLEIRRIVYGLLQAGLIEITRSENAAPQVPTVRVFPTEDKEEQKSLVNRLINRIRSL
jgi:DNA-binding MarR family transcriptional regulator